MKDRRKPLDVKGIGNFGGIFCRRNPAEIAGLLTYVTTRCNTRGAICATH